VQEQNRPLPFFRTSPPATVAYHGVKRQFPLAHLAKPEAGLKHKVTAQYAPLSRFIHHQKETPMNMTFSLAPLVALIAGILILVAPRLLNYIVAIYLIIIGLIGLFGGSGFHFR
jgi:hypothetical protein